MANWYKLSLRFSTNEEDKMVRFSSEVLGALRRTFGFENVRVDEIRINREVQSLESTVRKEK